MTQANDSITITPGAGATVATHTATGKEYQTIIVADSSGHILKTKETAAYWSAINTGAQNKIHFELFNAVGSGKDVKLIGLYLQCAAHDVDTPVSWEFDLDLTSAVGTGGTTLTGRKLYSANAAISASITARHAPSGGATKSFTYWPVIIDTLNNNQPGAAQFGRINIANTSGYGQDITLAEGEGIALKQITNNAVATWSVHALITME